MQRKVSCTKQHDYFFVYPYLEGKSEANTSVLAAWCAGNVGVGWSGGWDGLPNPRPRLLVPTTTQEGMG